MIVKICEIAQFTRATPGSSLVVYIFFIFRFSFLTSILSGPSAVAEASFSTQGDPIRENTHKKVWASHLSRPNESGKVCPPSELRLTHQTSPL